MKQAANQKCSETHYLHREEIKLPNAPDKLSEEHGDHSFLD